MPVKPAKTKLRACSEGCVLAVACDTGLLMGVYEGV